MLKVLFKFLGQIIYFLPFVEAQQKHLLLSYGDQHLLINSIHPLPSFWFIFNLCRFSNKNIPMRNRFLCFINQYILPIAHPMLLEQVNYRLFQGYIAPPLSKILNQTTQLVRDCPLTSTVCDYLSFSFHASYRNPIRITTYNNLLSFISRNISFKFTLFEFQRTEAYIYFLSTIVSISINNLWISVCGSTLLNPFPAIHFCSKEKSIFNGHSD